MNFKSLVLTTGVAFTGLVASGSFAPAQATVATFFNSTSTGANQFDSLVTGAGGTVVIDALTGLTAGPSINRGAYSISRINGATLNPDSYGTLNGQVFNINPSSTDVQASRTSGIQFSFNSAINALGFEVGDWGTCCQPSSLYMSFNNGPAIKVGTSTVVGDVQYNGVYEAFTGAIDDTGTFSTVQFWGDGLGELLYGGGRIRYANVAQGSLPPSTDVPEPFTIVGTLVGGFAALRMKKNLKSSTKA
ncbi:hypothetical protein [Chamaesiphon sp. VAR_48_metabat_135_sub]|uniref:hypothetical protein n=1 Tax=Chamaesiphon sp. VAR_48_metabat_135_sub TaxID=2964699 RepID=UPI00286CF009|nr:hypothetical protein [Chamaesiphon sp. VAR_48_metabat_135_sub]